MMLALAYVVTLREVIGLYVAAAFVVFLLAMLLIAGLRTLWIVISDWFRRMLSRKEVSK